MYRVLIKYCVIFIEFLESLPPLSRQHLAALGCTKNYQRIGVTVHSHTGEGVVAVNCEKTQFFPNTLYIFDSHVFPGSTENIQKTQ